MPSHQDPVSEVHYDNKGFAYVKIKRDAQGKPVYPEPEKRMEEIVKGKGAVIEKVKPLEEKKEEQVIEQPKVEGKKVYSYEDLFQLKKSEQVEILRNFGLSDEEIKKLNNEDKRIKKILQLQG